MATSNPPNGHPAIPDEIPADEVVAIVTIHHVRAQHVNRDTPYVKTPTIAGTNIFLCRINGQQCFTMGREENRDAGSRVRRDELDVYLPGTTVALRQCVLLPVWDHDGWRLQSSSEIIFNVNGAPIQNYTARTKKFPNPLPRAVFLKQSDVNNITIAGLQVDIWLMKSVRQAYGPQDFIPAPVETHIQDVAHRPEPWARNRFNLTTVQVSTKTFRVVDCFTGEMGTAKIFRTGERREQLRDQEFSMLNQQEVDASIVRYLQSTEINSIPAVITDTHTGFASYGILQDNIRKSHPGVRFAISSKLLRRLFSALSFMHFHGIIHGDVSNDSVLLRLVDQQLDHMLLVDYTTAQPFVPGEPAPIERMMADGRAAMALIESCCEIWAFRNGPTLEAMGEDLMQKRTVDTMTKYQTIQRVSADYFERQGNSRETVKGQKLHRLLNKLGNAWQSAKTKQAQNLAARQVALLSKSKINEKIEEWGDAYPSQASVDKQYMLLSLGQQYLDSLADQLYVKRWDATPQEVCAKIKELGGDLEEPWQTFEVPRATLIEHTDAGYNQESIMTWLASCYELHPDWRAVLETVCEDHFQSNAGIVSQANLHNLCNALEGNGQLPAPMIAMFERFADLDTFQPQIEESYQIWYHIPSRLFNITQLQRLATPDRLVATVTEGESRCDNFVEVRGDPKVQGCYASLTLLTTFADQLGLSLPEIPDLTTNMPTYDSSDFSQVPQGRIVLARLGLLGFGTMLRSGDQCNFLYSRTEPAFVTPSAFIPTYFGDMKVIPQLPPNVRSYNRPEHWSKFKTAEEFEDSADLSKRRMLVAKKPKAAKPQPVDTPVSALSDIMEIDESALGVVLRERERVRSEARPPPKRATDAISSKPMAPEPKRSKIGEATLSAPKVALPDVSQSFVERMENQAHSALVPAPQPSGTSLNNSFMKRNSALFTNPPLDPTNVNSSFTVADDTEGLEDDWAEVEVMLRQMPDNEDEELVDGITGFQYHGDLSDGSDKNLSESPDRELSESPQDQGKGKGKAIVSSTAGSPAKSATQSVSARQSRKQRSGSASQSDNFSSFGSPAKSFLRAHARVKGELPKLPAVPEDMPPTEPSKPLPTVPPASGGPSPRMTRGIPVLKFGSLGISSDNITFNPAIPTQPVRNPFSGTINSFGLGESFDSDMPPTQGNSLAGSFTDDLIQGTSLQSNQTLGPFLGGTSPTQVASFDSDMPPTQGNSLVGNFTSNPLQGPQVNTPPRAPLSDSSMPLTQANSPPGSPQLSIPGLQTGIYSNPGGAIVGFFRENVVSVTDADMPDTDGESEAGDLIGGEKGQ
jgi:hypothetical protein